MSVKVPPVGRLFNVSPLPPLVVTLLKLPRTARSMVWLVEPVNVRLSKPLTMPANLLSAEAVAASAAVMVKLSVPSPPETAAVGAAVAEAMLSESFPPPNEMALVGAVAAKVTVSAPAPPAKVALDASTVTLDAPVVADVSTAVTVAPERSAVMPAEPDTVTVFRAVEPAVEVKVRPLVPATVNAVIPPKVMLAKVEFAPVVVTFKVV